MEFLPGTDEAFATKFGLLGLTYDDVLLLPDASDVVLGAMLLLRGSRSPCNCA